MEQIENFSYVGIIPPLIEGAYEPTTLAGRFGIDPSNITYRTRRMELQGLVERCSNRTDGRVVCLRLTNEGLASCVKLNSYMYRVSEVIFSITSTQRITGHRDHLQHPTRYSAAF